MSKYVILDTFIFDPDLSTVSTMDGVKRNVRLSRMEVKVLEMLCDKSGKTVTRGYLFDNGWPNGTGNDGHLNRIILLLRRKFESLGAHDVINTLPKVGYSIENALIFHDSDGHVNNLSQVSITTTSKVQTSLNLVGSHEQGSNRDQEPSPVEIDDISSQEKDREFIYWKPLGFITISIILFITYYLYSDAHEADDSMYMIDGNVVSVTNHGNVSILYQKNIKEINEVVKVALKLVSKKIKNEHGRYYLGLSASSISIAYFDAQKDVSIKKIYLRSSENVFDELDCALQDINKHMNLASVGANEASSLGPVSNVGFIYEVSYGCPYPQREKVYWGVDVSYRESFGQLYFFSKTTITNNSGDCLFKVFNDGTIDLLNMKREPYNNWKSKTVSLMRNEKNVEGCNSIAAFKLLEAYSKSNYMASTVKVNNGIYFSNFMGGVVISTL
ncbi:winged helix-turn-helix domain-containing protein [Aeromonas salmonicida]|uniref:winged helix-turn-helix domain-containing protein n=1 Tax=Aeromonas salmonicida TaxID=645 RepID=UPI00223F4966|nr:winged helix-turn-helix domain-containing protein [Aeromonas salmonicida]